MPFFGNDVSLEKHRPNKERYPVGRAQEPEMIAVKKEKRKDLNSDEMIIFIALKKN